MTTNESATPVPAPVAERPPVVTTMPRLGRGVCWRDIVREIELDELEREARMREAA
ncbi:DUF6222 family protein [Amycolatopsis keratiniphila]|uniref:DUF6222 family protein n=1 Tax=Amycolatopsis keratiniphila TaxID=129921 RepID=UPI00087D0830|nr:DUF6222 family protein [Amycolatopsis keratiniphila]SDU41666.1 hypothetical protein SAMN04489733_3984 [Amycolatopsis keratiniphila]